MTDTAPTYAEMKRPNAVRQLIRRRKKKTGNGMRNSVRGPSIVPDGSRGKHETPLKSVAKSRMFGNPYRASIRRMISDTDTPFADASGSVTR